MTERMPRRCEPLTLEEQGTGFHAVLAGQVGSVLITNDVGRLVIDLCDGRRTPAQIVEEVANRHDGVTRDRVDTDVNRFLTTAVEKGVIAWN